MNRKEAIENLLHTFEQKACALTDDTLTKILDGELVFQLTPAIGRESGGAVKAASKSTTGQKIPVQFP